ncbi:hypothetical protein CRYUN_Cryun40dG0016500 [Craigia yunnanensis]
MGIKVHGIALSTCTARVLLCLCEKGLDYEIVPVDIPNSAHKQQPYLSLNPFGQIPALEDGDVKVFESRAISKYLARKYKDTGVDLLGSSSLTESIIVDTWMEVESHQFNSPMQTIIRQMVVNPIFGIACDEKIIGAELEKLGKVLDVYEERLSKCKYLAGDFYSLADLHHIPHLVYFMRNPRSSIITSRPHDSCVGNEMKTLPSIDNNKYAIANSFAKNTADPKVEVSSDSLKNEVSYGLQFDLSQPGNDFLYMLLFLAKLVHASSGELFVH